MSKLIILKDIHKGYRVEKRFIPVLNGVDLELNRGEWLSILGSSGSGKTTLLNLIGLLEKPYKGEIYFDNKLFSRVNDKESTIVRRKRIGFIFQFYHLLPELNVLENVRIAAMFNGYNRKLSESKAKELLYYVGLEDRLNHRPNELSGGEQQRVAIARALINNPDLILADEPTGNLDSKNSSEIISLFKELYRKFSKSIVMVTHDKSIASKSDRVVRIKDGKIC